VKKIHDIGLASDFLAILTEVQALEEKLDKWDYIT
jgi:hypothetical protein